MPIKLDHFFVLTEPKPPVIKRLTAIGWIEGPSNNHPGQGTANRRFFFSNSTLELLYIRDMNEARTGRAKRLCLAERMSRHDASPFGIVVKTTDGSTDTPFPGWKYCPEYFQDDQCFHVGENSDFLEEPLCICKPANLPQRKNVPPPENPQWSLTEFHISVPVARLSPALEAIAECDGVSVRLGDAHRLELVFNEEKQTRVLDLRPELPLIIRW